MLIKHQYIYRIKQFFATQTNTCRRGHSSIFLKSGRSTK